MKMWMYSVAAGLGLVAVGCAGNPETGQTGFQVAAGNVAEGIAAVTSTGIVPEPWNMVLNGLGVVALAFAGKKTVDAVRASSPGKLLGDPSEPSAPASSGV